MSGYQRYLLIILLLCSNTVSAHPLQQFISDNIWLLLIVSIAMLAAFLAFFWSQNRHHTQQLNSLVQQKTAELEAELQRRKALELHAKRESDRLQTLLDNTLESVITIDSAGNIQHFNHASTQLYGYQPEEIIGHNITQLMPAEYRPMHEQGMARFLKTEQPQMIGKAVQVEALHKSGQIIPIELTLSAFYWEDSYFFTGIARDISLRKAEHQALIAAKEEAEKANQAKSEFLSSMSHELRTPLNAILGFAQLLKSDPNSPLSDDQQSNVNIIQHSGEHLLKLINDVLELSKIEAGNIEVSLEPVEISQVIAHCLPLLQSQADDNEIRVDIAPLPARWVMADITRLKQVLINLLSNAIKYNRRRGMVSISSEVIHGLQRLRITIADSGIGIPVNRQSKLFTAFDRLGQENSGIEGSGVGLVVTEKLIRAMHGFIGFDSRHGEGSRFWIELPLAACPTEHASDYKDTESIRRQQVSDGTIRKVLYIEDNPANIKLMQAYFRQQPKFELHSCKMAETGLKVIQSLQPDLILMDINLPGISGLEASRQIQQLPDMQKIPIIAITAAAMPYDLQRAKGLFAAYLTKPLDFSELDKQLSLLL
ncbi:MAG TPA: ATP-binding protein [Methylophaga sp.]|nr:ATP-binding protein [Methylophaga sp.]